MNKIFAFFRMLYLITVIFFIYFSFVGKKLLGVDIGEIMNRYFGVLKYCIFVMLLGNFFISFIKNQKKKNTFIIINYLLFIGVVSAIYLYVVYGLGIMHGESLLHDISLERKIVDLTLVKYNIGLIPAYLVYKGILIKNPKILYLVIGVASVAVLLLLTLSFNWFILNNIKKVRKNYLARKKIEQEERELQEKIALKEAKEKEQIEHFKRMEAEAEKRIREEVNGLNFGRNEFEITEIRSKIQRDLADREKIVEKEAEKNDSSIEVS